MVWIACKYKLKSIFCIAFIGFYFPVLASDKLVFATHTRPPLSLYLTEVMQEALKPHSIKVEVIELPGSRVITEVNNGKADGDLSRVINFKEISDTNTSNYLLVNEPIVLTELVMVTLASTRFSEPITWDTINQGSVAYLRGSKTIRKHIHPSNRVALASNLQVLEMVESERVSAAIMFNTVLKSLLNRYPNLKDKLTVQTPALLSFHLYPYLNKKHAKLIDRLSNSLKLLKDDGFLEYVAHKYNVTASAESSLAVKLQSSTNADLP